MNFFSEYSRFFIQKNCRYKNGGPRKLMGTKKKLVKQRNWIKKMLVLKKCGYRKFWQKKMLKNWIPKHFLEVTSPET